MRVVVLLFVGCGVVKGRLVREGASCRAPNGRQYPSRLNEDASCLLLASQCNDAIAVSTFRANSTFNNCEIFGNGDVPQCPALSAWARIRKTGQGLPPDFVDEIESDCYAVPDCTSYTCNVQGAQNTNSPCSVCDGGDTCTVSSLGCDTDPVNEAVCCITFPPPPP
eukprot:Hpha_TRINITY_DN26365_c0_g1::TRINITY_DN26365_c0_g1_i1::g.9533::m.9533